ncbi:hypothetical protein [Burkholderia sp. Ac-20349]|uniref:hypothetical protein n=1 Tax=Burkholderia sp. Ac-20349 TaxID=2703893 RepID=UPI001F11EEC9|nr:hypothetical protein [Burkholderia sp. Ac-20349]
MVPFASAAIIPGERGAVFKKVRARVKPASGTWGGWFGIDPDRENDGAIGRLANLVIEAVGHPASFAALTPVRQNLFPWTFRDELRRVESSCARFHDDHRTAPPVHRMAARRGCDGSLERAAAVGDPRAGCRLRR